MSSRKAGSYCIRHKNRNRMEYLKAQVLEGRQRVETSSKSMRARQTEKFIPPTHPVYVITSSFEAPHISSLQEQLDKHYIAMGMQTGKKKLAKMPDMPTDKFFIIVDDSGVPIVLEGEFLTLPSKVVRYPRANSAEEVVKAFEKYIGLGHYEIRKEYEQVSNDCLMQGQDHALKIERGRVELSQQMAQQTAGTGQSSQMGGLASNLSTSGIRLREVSSINHSTLIKGLLFIYDNRKDSLQFKALVSKLKVAYQTHSRVRFFTRIDEYISYIRIGKRYDNVILMSEYSYLNLGKHFQKFKGFAVFQEINTQINLFTAKNVLFFAQDEGAIQAYVHKVIEGNGEAQGNLSKVLREHSAVESLKVPERLAQENKQPMNRLGQQFGPIYGEMQELERNNDDRGDRLNQKGNRPLLVEAPSQSLRGSKAPQNEKMNQKSQIRLVKVSDLSKQDIKRLTEAAQQYVNTESGPNPDLKAQDAVQKSNESLKPKDEHAQIQKKGKKNKLFAQTQNFSINGEQQKKKDSNESVIAVIRQLKVAESDSKGEAKGMKRDKQMAVDYASPKVPSIDKGVAMEQSQRSISQMSAKSKIKRLKSVKQLKNNPKQSQARKLTAKAQPQKEILNKANPASTIPKQHSNNNSQKPPISSILKGHLRMGSDENDCRNNQKPKLSHYRALSADKDKDHQQSYIKICLTSPKPSEESQGQEHALPEGTVEGIQSNQYQEQRAIVRSVIPLSSQSAQLSEKRVDQDSQANKQERVAFYPEMGVITKGGFDAVQNSFGKFGNNQYRIGMPVLSEKEIEDDEEKATAFIPKQSAPLKIAAQLLKNNKQHLKAEHPNTFNVAIIPQNPNYEEQNQTDPFNKRKLNQGAKVKAAQQSIFPPSTSLNHTNRNRKVMKSPPIPPSFQLGLIQRQSQSQVEQYSSKVPKIDLVPPSEQSRLKQQSEGAFDICGTSDISSIPRKQAHKATEKKANKRFTFGAQQELGNKLGQKKSPQKVKLSNNLKNQIAYKKMGSEESLESENKQPAIPITTDTVGEPRGKISQNIPRKSKSQSQVQRIFDRFKVRAAVQTGNQPSGSNLTESQPTQSKGFGLAGNLSSHNSDPRVGKIYSQLRSRPSTHRLARDRGAKPQSVDEYPPSEFRNKMGSFERTNRYQKQGPSIEDMIDMNRYEKVIENGITVYRSRVPVRVENYYPSKISPTIDTNLENPYSYGSSMLYPQEQTQRSAIAAAPLSSLTERSTQPLKSQDPYLLYRNSPRPREDLLRNKENAQAKPAARVLARFVPKQPQQIRPESGKYANYFLPSSKPVNNDSIGIQCSADPFNSLTNVNNNQLLNSISNLTKSPKQPNTSKFSTVKVNPKKAVSKSPHPIQDLLASKLSDSEKEASITPPLVRNLILPKFLTEEQYQGIEDSKDQKEESFQMQDGSNQKLVLYLADKLHPKDIYSDLSRLKSHKDSLLSFKNQQQLLLQLSQTKQIFDIVYVISASPLDFSRILGRQKNCYLVELQDGCKTRIKGNLIKVASLKYLKDVTELILKQSKSHHKLKPRQQKKPMKSSHHSIHNSCISPRLIPPGRVCCQYSMNYCPVLSCTLHHMHC